ncbi:MAG: preprotein translocase subunit SecY [Clostridia bacterium]|nr:preprotein translocase subunit SecY [Clostridia bacterium]
MFSTIRNAFRVPELRKKIWFTIAMMIVFRFGAHIPVPFLSKEAMEAFLGGGGTDLFSLFNVFTGGAFANATVMALGVSPYINASIIMQLLAVAIPALERLSKEGLEGRKKINKITRYVGIILAFVQGAGLYITLHNMGVENPGLEVIKNEGVLTFFIITLTFTAGTAFVVWLGEQITEKGIGNGVSLIIFAGIISSIPSGAVMIYNQFLASGVRSLGNVLIAVGIMLIAILAVVLVVFFDAAERRIPVQYAKRVVGRKMYGGQSTNIPIKVVMGGVMPIIFASSIMAFPATIVRLVSSGNLPQEGIWYRVLGCLTAGYGPAWTDAVYAVIYFLLIIFFTYFYSSIQFNPIEMANNMKKSGGYIPGYRPGKPTSDYIAKVASRLNLTGAFFLGIIAVLPVIMGAAFGIQGIQIGGTSLLIMEGVALESVRQIESQLVMRNYKGFLE